jgi:glutathione S-transferase
MPARKPMKLFYSPFHDFIHKSVVIAEEVGLWDQIEEVPVYPRKHGYSIAALNPLAKVPTLALDSGEVFFGSQTIAEYLDSISANGVRVYPAPGPKRWDALTRLALADLFFDIVTRMIHERLAEPPGEHIIQWHWPKVIRTLDRMEQDAQRLEGFAGGGLDIGQIGTLQAVTFFERQMEIGLPPPAPTSFNWREGRPALALWFELALQRPSVATHFKTEFAGDDSAAFCQVKVAEVLRAQGREEEAETVGSMAADFVAPETAAARGALKH